MAVTPALLAHCVELLSPLSAVQARRMFGGQGLYADGLFVALIAGDVLYLKADEVARPAFEAAGSQHFGFTTPAGHRAVMGYWSAPDGAMESPAQMAPWARLALASALRAAAAKRPAAARKARPVKAQTRAQTGARVGARVDAKPGAAAAPPVATRKSRAPAKS